MHLVARLVDGQEDVAQGIGLFDAQRVERVDVDLRPDDLAAALLVHAGVRAELVGIAIEPERDTAKLVARERYSVVRLVQVGKQR